MSTSYLSTTAAIALLFTVIPALSWAQDKGAAAPEPAITPLAAPKPATLDEAKEMLISTYGKIAEATYSDALSLGIQLRKEIKAFVAEPGVPNHIGAKLTWVQSRLPYLQSEVFLLSESPIAPGLNGWPVDESFIDAVDGDAGAGVINDADGHPELTTEALEGIAAGAKVGTGYHAIEFLLWGQDLDAEGRGKRTYADYTVDGAPNAERRGDYLAACADVLVRGLSDQLGVWRAGKADNYRAQFEALPTDEALARVLGSVLWMAGDELAGVRIGKPYQTKDDEFEQSDFSDTTHLDVLHNVAGLANIAAGAYVGTDGKLKVLGVGLVALADKVSAERGEKMREAINGAMKTVRALETPFDKEIAGDDSAPGRVRVKAVIDALNAFALEVKALATELGVELK